MMGMSIHVEEKWHMLSLFVKGQKYSLVSTVCSAIRLRINIVQSAIAQHLLIDQIKQLYNGCI